MYDNHRLIFFLLTGNGFTGPINFYRAAFALKALYEPLGTGLHSGAGLTMPTLVIWGDRDGALDTPLAQLSAKRCKGKVTEESIGKSLLVVID